MTTPTGTVDLHEKDILIRNFIFNTAKQVLKLRGVTQIETPAMELLDTVKNLYGEEFNKLVYHLNDWEDNQNTETNNCQKLILRYDLTVPTARYVGANGLVKFRRFQYGKVYRRDNPQIQKGRYREFYQFDYDIIGDDQNSGSNDLEMLETLSELMNAIIGSNTYVVKINHRGIVAELVKVANIPNNLHSVVFSALDKLDKKSFEEIKEELKQKGLNDTMIESLELFYNILNSETVFSNILEKLQELGVYNQETFERMQTINLFLNKMNLTNFKLDPFLIRGMDYYTGIIFEVVYNNSAIIESTISSGGRYDNMIEKFSTRGKIPAIGMSLGVERLVKILEQTKFKDMCFEPTPQIFVATVGKNMTVNRIILCNQLRKMGYYTIASDLIAPDMRQQFSVVFEKYSKVIPVMIVIGDKEINENIITIKDVNKKNKVS